MKKFLWGGLSYCVYSAHAVACTMKFLYPVYVLFNGSTVLHLHMKCVLLLFYFGKNKIISTYSTKPLVYHIL